MSSHLTKKQFAAFQQQALSAAELLALDEHLASCEACRQHLNAAVGGDASFAMLQAESLQDNPPAHLAFEQMAGFVEGRLDQEALQIAQDHLAVCPVCRAATEDLRSFSQIVAPDLQREVRPAETPIATTSFWQRINAFFSVRFAASAFVGALCLLIGAWFVWQFMNAREPAPIAVTNPSPSPSVPPSVTPTPEAAPTKLLAQLNDGGRQFALNEQGMLQGAEGLPESYQQLIKQALAQSRLARPTTMNDLGSRSGAMMGSNDAQNNFRLTDPIGKVILSATPTLRWQALQGATQYEVEIFDQEFNSVLKSEALSNPSWSLSKPLARGRVYSWQVKAIKDGQEFKAPQPPALARFRVVGKKEADALQDARRRYPTSHLLLGQLYAQAGLLTEAEQEFHVLQKANPNAPSPQQLLREINKLRQSR